MKRNNFDDGLDEWWSLTDALAVDWRAQHESLETRNAITEAWMVMIAVRIIRRCRRWERVRPRKDELTHSVYVHCLRRTAHSVVQSICRCETTQTEAIRRIESGTSRIHCLAESILIGVLIGKRAKTHCLIWTLSSDRTASVRARETESVAWIESRA